MFRKPNFKTRIKARTTGRAKRAIKSSINPFYGKKGMGYLKNPSKAYKDRWYKKTTVDSLGFMKGGSTYNDDAYYDDFHDEFPLLVYKTDEEIREEYQRKQERKKAREKWLKEFNVPIIKPMLLALRYVFKNIFWIWIGCLVITFILYAIGV